MRSAHGFFNPDPCPDGMPTVRTAKGDKDAFAVRFGTLEVVRLWEATGHRWVVWEAVGLAIDETF